MSSSQPAGPHVPQKIVITGGPGSGKTVVTSAVVNEAPHRFALVPESATQVYAQLATRWDKLDLAGRYGAQRRMYRLQLEQEARLAAAHPGKALLLDRGTIDGGAYWPDGPDAFWRDVGSSPRQEFARYDAVILLETCATLGLYDGDESNFCRFEDAAGAVAAGETLKALWANHPHVHHVGAFFKMADKLAAVREILGDITTA